MLTNNEQDQRPALAHNAAWDIKLADDDKDFNLQEKVFYNFFEVVYNQPVRFEFPCPQILQHRAKELDVHSMGMSTSNDSASFAHPISDLIMGMSTSNESATFAHPISDLM